MPSDPNDHFDLPSGVSLDAVWSYSVTAASVTSEKKLVAAYIARICAIQNAGAPLLQLSPELLECIFDYLYDYEEHDTRDMRACALVCRCLSSAAQRRIFSSLRLLTPKDIAEMLQLARTKPSLYAACRKLVIRGDLSGHVDDAADDTPIGGDDWVALLSPLDRVQELHLVDLSPGCALFQTAARPILAGMSSRATTLTLSQFFFDDGPAFHNFMSPFAQLRSLTLAHGRFDETATGGGPLASPLVHLRSLAIRSCEIITFDCINAFVGSNSLVNLVIHVVDAESDDFRPVCKDIVARSSKSLRRLCINPDSLQDIQYIIDGLPQDSPCLRDIALYVDWLILDQIHALNGLQIPRIHSLTLDRLSVSWNPVTLPKLLQVHVAVRAVQPLAALGVLSLQLCTDIDKEPTILADLVDAGCLRLCSDRRIVASPSPASESLEERKYTYDISSIVTGGEHIVLHIYRTRFLDSCRSRVPETVTKWCFAILYGLEATKSDDWYTT